MAYQFTKPPIMRDGEIFLGVRDDGQKVGVPLRSHLLTFAGTGTGKGTSLIIPNLRQWADGSTLTIDPKGENAEQSWQHREAMGQRVYVLDPMRAANVPDRLRVSFNPLAEIMDRERQRRAAGLPSTAREDIRAIADGMVMRYSSEHGMWDNGSVSIIAGVIADCLTNADPENLNLAAVRRILMMPDDLLEEVLAGMANNAAFGGLARAASKFGLSKAKSTREYMKGAVEHTDWLDNENMADLLSRSDFSLSELKNGKTSLFLVLPPDYLEEHARFLRLFVRLAINAMARGGQDGGKCLFILDEFFSLGRIDEIAKTVGLMRSYGVHLWPILQDLPQLISLYGKDNFDTFFSNSSAHIFFGNGDPVTVQHIAERLGRYGPDEVTTMRPAPFNEPFIMPSKDPKREIDVVLRQMDANHARQEHQMESWIQNHLYETEARKVGQPRVAPEVVREMVSQKATDDVARSMIVFGQGRDVFNLRLAPYFRPLPAAIPPDPAIEQRRQRNEQEEQERTQRRANMDRETRFNESADSAWKSLAWGAVLLFAGLYFYDDFINHFGEIFIGIGIVLIINAAIKAHEAYNIKYPKST